MPGNDKSLSTPFGLLVFRRRSPVRFMSRLLPSTDYSRRRQLGEERIRFVVPGSEAVRTKLLADVVLPRAQTADLKPNEEGPPGLPTHGPSEHPPCLTLPYSVSPFQVNYDQEDIVG